jgi:hypothetical protein
MALLGWIVTHLPKSLPRVEEFLPYGAHFGTINAINMTLEANDTIKIDIRYSDPMLAQAVISNLPHILEDMLDEAFEESFNYNIDEELKRILEEGK